MLTDFGIARLADSPGLTRTDEFVGTPAYVAPESAEGRPQTSAVDIYGAGILLYELVTGQPPFSGANTLDVLHRHLSEEPRRPTAVPDPLWTVIERCLRKRPDERPSAGTSPARCAPSPPGSACTPRPSRRRPRSASASAARTRPGARAGAGGRLCRWRAPTQVMPSRAAPAVRPGGRDQRDCLDRRLPAGGGRRATELDGRTRHAARRAPGAGARRPAPLAEPDARRPRPQRADPGPATSTRAGPAAPPPAAAAAPGSRPGRDTRAAAVGYGYAAAQQRSASRSTSSSRSSQPQQQQQSAQPQPQRRRPLRSAAPPRREPRRAARTRCGSPALGCLKGCLFMVLILVVIVSG